MKLYQFYDVGNQMNSKPVLGFLTLLICSSFEANAASWEAQAERLQLVSASYLDAQPLLSPTPAQTPQYIFRIEAKTIVTAIPKANGTVGSKIEQPPQPPAHTIPTAEVSVQTKQLPFKSSPILRTWAGILPGSAAAATGMDAICEQSIFGVSLGLRNQSIPKLDLLLEGGQQLNRTKVEGAMTEFNSHDQFDVSSKLNFLSLTMLPAILPGSWVQAQITERSVDSKFKIPADGTTIKLSDHSSIRSGNASSQVTIGYQFGNGFQAAVGYLNTPLRMSTPRFLLSYSVSTNQASEHNLASAQ